MAVRIGGLLLKNPVMTASGTFGYGQEYAPFVDLNRLGALVVKGLSLKPRAGNPPPRIMETRGGMLNAIGLENVGVEAFIAEKLPYLRDFDVVVIVNIFGETVDEYRTVAEILRQKGWNTAWFGKNHNVPDWQNSQAGPFDLWPTGLGFEKFYGFIGAETSQWRPAVFDGTKPIEPYLVNPDYNFDYDMAEQAIEWVRNQKAVAPDKPFFLYYAPGATHSPHQPKKEWIAKYKGKFDQGWDKVREETLARQKKLGIVPADTKPHRA
jgi:hypothetical protein